MTNCVKCGAELIGSKKFCAACGTPVADPRAAGTAGGPSSAYGGAPPPSGVNPFAETAFPRKEQRPSLYGPPPEPPKPAPAAGSPAPPPANESSQVSQMQVSPLAVSNALSQRPAEAQVAMNAAAVAMSGHPPSASAVSVAKPVASQGAPAPVPSKKGGTQMMPLSFQQPQPTGVSSGALPPAAPSSSPTQQPPMPPVIASPAAAFQPPQQQPYYAPMPGQAPAQPQQAQQPPQQSWQQPAPWSAQQQAPQYGYPPQPQQAFGGYPPGTHVAVTWANGQRYPGTIQQVAGTRCLVVFPDGQQHWVEMQYVTPV